MPAFAEWTRIGIGEMGIEREINAPLQAGCTMHISDFLHEFKMLTLVPYR